MAELPSDDQICELLETYLQRDDIPLDELPSYHLRDRDDLLEDGTRFSSLDMRRLAAIVQRMIDTNRCLVHISSHSTGLCVYLGPID